MFEQLSAGYCYASVYFLLKVYNNNKNLWTFFVHFNIIKNYYFLNFYIVKCMIYFSTLIFWLSFYWKERAMEWFRRSGENSTGENRITAQFVFMFAFYHTGNSPRNQFSGCFRVRLGMEDSHSRTVLISDVWVTSWV